MKIYIASKVKYGQQWIELRNKGYNIISTWIDEWLPNSTQYIGDLLIRCIKESSECDVLILYCEPYDVLKCALIEVGAALTSGKKVIIVGICHSVDSETLYAHPNVYKCEDIETALFLANKIYK